MGRLHARDRARHGDEAAAVGRTTERRRSVERCTIARPVKRLALVAKRFASHADPQHDREDQHHQQPDDRDRRSHHVFVCREEGADDDRDEHQDAERYLERLEHPDVAPQPAPLSILRRGREE